MGIVEPLLVFSVGTLNLPVMTRGIGTDQLMPDTKTCYGCLKKRRQMAFGIRKAIGKLKTVIGLNTLDGNAFAGKMLDDLA